MDQDRLDHERAIELLTKRNPLTLEQAEDLFRILTAPNSHRVHKSVANYMANEAGLDRTRLEEMVSAAVAARNPGYMVKQEVEKYFKCRADGTYKAEDAMREAITAEVRKYVREHLDKEAGTYLMSTAHEIAGRIFRASENDADPAPRDGQPSSAPGLSVYPFAAMASWDMAAHAAQKWMDHACGSDRRHVHTVCMPRKDRPDDPWSVVVPHARLSMGDEAYGRMCAMLRGDAGSVLSIGMPIPVDGDWDVPVDIKKQMLAGAIRTCNISAYLYHRDGLLCLPPKEMDDVCREGGHV